MVDDDRNHAEAIRIWRSINRALVPAVVLLELSYFLVKHKMDLEPLKKVITDPKVQVVANGLEDVAYLTSHSKDVKYYDDIGDLIIVSVAKRMGCELKTFDESLARIME